MLHDEEYGLAFETVESTQMTQPVQRPCKPILLEIGHVFGDARLVAGSYPGYPLAESQAF